MAYLKNLTRSVVITKYVTFNKSQELNISVQTALDGTEYLTRIGSPTYSYDLELYVDNTGRDALMTAFDTLDELEVSVRAGTYKGRIKKLSSFETVYYGWYKVTATLSAVYEVNDR